MRPRHLSTEVYRCQVCGTTKRIYRFRGNIKSKGHLKHMYCFMCCKDKVPFRKL